MNNTEQYYMIFSERLVNLRKEKGIKQETLAADLKISQQTLSKWENGHSEPTLLQLYTLAGLFDVSMDYLVGMSNDRHIKDIEAIKMDLLRDIQESFEQLKEEFNNNPVNGNNAYDILKSGKYSKIWGIAPYINLFGNNDDDT